VTPNPPLIFCWYSMAVLVAALAAEAGMGEAVLVVEPGALAAAVEGTAVAVAAAVVVGIAVVVLAVVEGTAVAAREGARSAELDQAGPAAIPQ
jgi:hypothetical protein